MAGQTFSDDNRYTQPLQISLSIREWCELVQGTTNALGNTGSSHSTGPTSQQASPQQTREVINTITQRLPDFARQALGMQYQTTGR